jgi:type IX secretion system PorP/SprF family membrane protein
MYRLFCLILFMISTIVTSAQQLPVYSQYMMNGFLLNPAVVGHEGYTAINLTAREQWLGLQNAPSTYALSGQTRLLKNSFISRSASIRRRKRVMSRSGRIGMGCYVFTDRNGAFNRTGIQGTYSYHITMSTYQLSFGLSLTGFQFRIDEDKIQTYDPSDRLLMETKKSALIPDANFGVYYTDRHIYAGISGLQLFQSTLKLSGNEGIGFKMIRHYYLMAGYRFDIIDFLFTEPSFLLKTTEKGVAQLDMSLKFYFKEDYWAGVSYRTGGRRNIFEEATAGTGSSIIIMAGARVDKFYFGYAFDYTLSSIGKYSIGSHEIMLAVKFGDSARRYRWLNRY